MTKCKVFKEDDCAVPDDEKPGGTCPPGCYKKECGKEDRRRRAALIEAAARDEEKRTR